MHQTSLSASTNSGLAAPATLIRRCRTELSANRTLFASDVLSVAVAAVVAALLARGGADASGLLTPLPNLAALSIVVVMPVFVACGFYRRHARSSSLRDLTVLLPGLFAGVAILGIAGSGAGLAPAMPETTWPILFLVLLPLVGGVRLVARRRELGRRSAKAGTHSTVLLVGTGAASELFLRAIEHGRSRYAVVGIVDSSDDSKDLLFRSAPILGSVRNPQEVIARLAGQRRPDYLVISGSATHFDRSGLTRLVDWAEGLGIEVRALPDVTDPLEGLGSRPGGEPRHIVPDQMLARPQTTVEHELLSRVYRNRRVLVTGAGGSIGSEMVRQIASLRPAELVLIDNCEFNAYQIERSLARHFPDVARKLHICCVRDRAKLDAIFAAHAPELVFNAAALKHVPLVEENPCEGVLTNVVGARNVADAARASGALALVQISTDKAVNASSVMGATKRVAEFYCQAQDLITREIGCDSRFFTVRFGNVLGSSGSLIPLFQEQIARGGPLTVTDPRMERYFMSIREAVELTLVAAAHGLSHHADNGRIFVLDMGKPVRIMALAERMIRLAGKEPGRDIAIKVVGIRPGEKLFEELFDREEARQPSGLAGVNCAIPAPIPMSRLRAAICTLERAARAGDTRAVRACLGEIVPGYAAETAGAPQDVPSDVIAAMPMAPIARQMGVSA